MKKYLKSILALSVALSMFFSTTTYAANENKLVDGVEFKETQSYSDYFASSRTFSSSQGNIFVVVAFGYTVSWDEGYAGWFNNASFEISYITIAGVEYDAKPDGQSYYNGSSAYQRYTVNGLTLLMGLHADEWGNVTWGIGEV